MVDCTSGCGHHKARPGSPSTGGGYCCAPGAAARRPRCPNTALGPGRRAGSRYEVAGRSGQAAGSCPGVAAGSEPLDSGYKFGIKLCYNQPPVMPSKTLEVNNFCAVTSVPTGFSCF